MMQSAGDKLNGVGVYRSDLLIAVIANEARRSSGCLKKTNMLQDTGLLRCARNDQ